MSIIQLDLRNYWNLGVLYLYTTLYKSESVGRLISIKKFITQNLLLILWTFKQENKMNLANNNYKIITTYIG